MTENSLILHCGSFSCKGGWSINMLPSVEVTAFEDGSESFLHSVGGWKLKSLKGADSAKDPEALWLQCAHSLVMPSLDRHSVYLCDDRLEEWRYRVLAAEVFFEVFEAPYLTTVQENNALKASLNNIMLETVTPNVSSTQYVENNSLNSNTFLILDVGHESIKLWPFFDSFAAKSLTNNFSFGCRLGTALIHSRFHQPTGLKGNHHCCWKLSRHLFELDNHTDIERSQTNFTISSWNSHTIPSVGATEFLKSVFECESNTSCCCWLCSVSNPKKIYNGQIKSDNRSKLLSHDVLLKKREKIYNSIEKMDNLYSFVDSSQIAATEVLLNPSKLVPLLQSQISCYSKGLSEILFQIINDSPIDYRRHLYNNIILLGGFACNPTFAKRLVTELEELVQKNIYQKFSKKLIRKHPLIQIRALFPSNNQEGRSACWIGTRNMSFETADSLSRNNYLENGDVIINKYSATSAN